MTRHAARGVAGGPGRRLRRLAGGCGVTLLALIGSAVSASASDPAACPNAQFRSGASAVLPDCRAFEKVSPEDKNGSDILLNGARGSDGGDAVAYMSQGGFADPEGAGVPVTYLSRRGADGWSTRAITPPQEPDPGATSFGVGFYGFSDDLLRGVVRSYSSLASGQPSNARLLYLRDNVTGATQAVSSVIGAPTPPLGLGFTPKFAFAGGSSDFSHVFFESRKDISPDTSGDCNGEFADCPAKAYEWHDGTLRSVGILPADEGGGLAPASLVGTGAYLEYDTLRAVSTDGQRVVFTVPATLAVDYSFQSEAGEIYVRQSGTTTIPVSRSQRAVVDPDGNQPKRFEDATSDGARVFFTSTEKLTDGSTADVTAGDASLYRYDLVDGRLTDLAVDQEPVDGAANVLGVLGVSDGGSTVYFVADGQLISGGADPGQLHIYRYAAGHLGDIATIASTEGAPWSGTTITDGRGAIVSADGRRMVIETRNALTGYDDPDGDGMSSLRQVFVYDAVAHGFACVSCRPDGRSPTPPGTGSNADDVAGATFRPLGVGGNYPIGLRVHRTLTSNGSVFFQTTEPLVARDVNGLADVYEYHEGTLSLISSGTSAHRSMLASVSGDGRDVFVLTRQQLTATDHDDNLDMYDARVGGGQVVPEVPSAPAPCEGDQCQGPQAPPATAPLAGSLSFTGAGNPPGSRPVAPRAGVTLSKVKAVTGTVAAVKVRVTGPGAITASGLSIAKASRTSSRATTYTLKLSLTAKATRTLARKRTLKAKVKVSFRAKDGRTVSKSFTITFKRGKRS